MQVVIILPSGQIVANAVTGSYAILEAVNPKLDATSYDSFDLCIAGDNLQAQDLNPSFFVRAERHYATLTRPDLIIVPALRGEPSEFLPQNLWLTTWIKQMYEEGSEIASMCTGAFLLAEAGLLDGKACSTHWLAAEALQKAYPKIKVQVEKIITDEKGIYTSGGAFSSFNLIIYLVEKYTSKSLANWIANLYEIDIGRDSQIPFAIFQNQYDHGDPTIEAVQHYIESYYAEELRIPALAERFALSRRSFIRRFKAATGNTPLQYIQRVRIEAAKRLLEQNQSSISEVIYRVGYHDQRSFREIFRRHCGLNPQAYRDRYKRTSITF